MHLKLNFSLPPLPPPRSDTILQQFFVSRCRANLHVLLVLEAQDASLQRLVVALPKMWHLAGG